MEPNRKVAGQWQESDRKVTGTWNIARQRQEIWKTWIENERGLTENGGKTKIKWTWENKRKWRERTKHVRTVNQIQKGIEGSTHQKESLFCSGFEGNKETNGNEPETADRKMKGPWLTDKGTKWIKQEQTENGWGPTWNDGKIKDIKWIKMKGVKGTVEKCQDSEPNTKRNWKKNKTLIKSIWLICPGFEGNREIARNKQEIKRKMKVHWPTKTENQRLLIEHERGLIENDRKNENIEWTWHKMEGSEGKERKMSRQ